MIGNILFWFLLFFSISVFCSPDMKWIDENTVRISISSETTESHSLMAFDKTRNYNLVADCVWKKEPYSHKHLGMSIQSKKETFPPKGATIKHNSDIDSTSYYEPNVYRNHIELTSPYLVRIMENTEHLELILEFQNLKLPITIDFDLSSFQKHLKTLNKDCGLFLPYQQ